ncbi:MAG: hypothetical protein DMG82_25655 [Acidobacteria bacterium]|nr:MAG: hypothetical protein DMG82_25655 [Acidobacteriota bacterium]
MMHLESTLQELVRGIASIVRATLQEIFDESAYARFLLRRQLQTSPEAYAEFLRENEASRRRRPRCC